MIHGAVAGSMEACVYAAALLPKFSMGPLRTTCRHVYSGSPGVFCFTVCVVTSHIFFFSWIFLARGKRLGSGVGWRTAQQLVPPPIIVWSTHIL